MKFNKKQIIVSAFALIIGASLAGSVSGTIAWYQYSTRVSAGFIGSAVGVSENLQVSFAGENDWNTRLMWQDVNDKIEENGYATRLMPISAGALGKDDALGGFKANPIFGIKDFDNWIDAEEANYAKLSLDLRFVKSEGGEESLEEKEVYLSDLVIEQNANATADLSNAVRVHFHTSETEKLVSKEGGAIDVHGPLDLDGNDEDDVEYENDKYNFNGGQSTAIDYGVDGQQEAYKAEDILAAPVNGSLELDNKDGNLIGTIPAGGVLTVDVTIWLEGWQKIDGSAIWDADFEEATQFNVGFEFIVEGDQL